jgi:hypothetical protein
VSFQPAAIQVGALPGGFYAYTGAAAAYDITVARDALYGRLPAMAGVPAAKGGDVLVWVLPPKEEAVTDGGFERGDLSAWQTGGTMLPTLSTDAHTGAGAARLDSARGDSVLSQVVTPAGSDGLTLSLLGRLAVQGTASTLEVALASGGALSAPVSYSLTLETETWRHVWFDLGGPVSEPLTLTLRVAGDAPVLVDEVSLGPATQGGHWVYLPLVDREP